MLIYQLGLPTSIAHILVSLLSTTLTLSITLNILRRYSDLTLQELRIASPESWRLWGFVGLLLPLFVTGFYLLCIAGTYTEPTDQQVSLTSVIHTIFIAGLAAGIGEEFLFRGVIMGILEKNYSTKIAIFFPSILFGILHVSHISNPTFFDLALLLIGGTAVGVMFSFIALQSRSIWTGAWVHSLWNICIIGSFFHIGIQDHSALFFSYTLSSSEQWLTGGGFGIEAGAPATCAYLATAFLAWHLHKKNSLRAY